MDLLIKNLLRKKWKRSSLNGLDYYQKSINRIGAEQFRKLAERGLSLPVGAL